MQRPDGAMQGRGKISVFSSGGGFPETWTWVGMGMVGRGRVWDGAGYRGGRGLGSRAGWEAGAKRQAPRAMRHAPWRETRNFITVEEGVIDEGLLRRRNAGGNRVLGTDVLWPRPSVSIWAADEGVNTLLFHRHRTGLFESWIVFTSISKSPTSSRLKLCLEIASDDTQTTMYLRLAPNKGTPFLLCPC